MSSGKVYTLKKTSTSKQPQQEAIARCCYPFPSVLNRKVRSPESGAAQAPELVSSGLQGPEVGKESSMYSDTKEESEKLTRSPRPLVGSWESLNPVGVRFSTLRGVEQGVQPCSEAGEPRMGEDSAAFLGLSSNHASTALGPTRTRWAKNCAAEGESR
eukprot:RCo028261